MGLLGGLRSLLNAWGVVCGLVGGLRAFLGGLECSLLRFVVFRPASLESLLEGPRDYTTCHSSSSSSVDRWTQVVDLYVQSVVYHSEYRTIRIQ